MSLLTRFAKAFTAEDRGADEPSGLIEDQQGRVYYIKPDGTRVEVGGGGGSLPVPSLQDFNSSPITTVGDGSNNNMDWYTAAVFGDDLVDLSDTARPAVRVGGIYAVTVNLVAVSDMSAGGYFDLQLHLDANGLDLGGVQDSRTATAAQKRPQLVVCEVAYIPTGGLIIATMHNYDGSASVDFSLGSAFIQRMT